MRAILIDAKNREIIEIDADGLADMQKAVGGYIETAYQFSNADTVYVNEDGLLVRPLPNEWFVIEGAHQPFVGNGIVCGFDPKTGETVPAKSAISFLKEKIKFIDRQTAAAICGS